MNISILISTLGALVSQESTKLGATQRAQLEAEVKKLKQDAAEEKRMLEALRAEKADLQADVAALRKTREQTQRKLELVNRCHFFNHVYLYLLL
jgi:chromosome segregation ATPase